jgi:hypothetical protein
MAFMRKIELTRFTMIASAAMALSAVGCTVPADFPSQAELYDEKPDPRRFILYSHGAEVMGAQVDGGGVLGLGVNLGRYTDADDHAVRGKVWGLLVDVKVEGDRAEGLVGGLPVDVAVSRDEVGRVRVQGLVYGRPVNYRLGTDTVAGKLGRCAYALSRGRGTYLGAKSCGASWNEPLEMQMPPAFAQWSDAERAVAVSLLLFPG